MAKRKFTNPPPINIESFGKNLNKKLKVSKQNPQQQPIKYKSKREKEIHELINKIKSERLFIYKNAHRHIKLALGNIGNPLNLSKVLSDYHTTLKEFDALESSLKAELETLKIPETNPTATPVLPLPINQINTSAASTATICTNNAISTTLPAINLNISGAITTTTANINNENSIIAPPIINTLPVTSTTATLLDVNTIITATVTPTTTTTSNSSTKNNHSPWVSKPITRGVRSVPFIDMKSSDEDEDYDDSDEDYVDEDEETTNADNIPLLDSNDSTPSTSPRKRVSKTKTRATKNSRGVIGANITAITAAPIGTASADTNASAINGTTTTTDANIVTDGINSIATTDAETTTTTTTTTTKKKRGRPTKVIPDNCYVCRRTKTPYWRKGTDNDVVVDLCNACGLHYMKKEKKDRLSKQKHSINNVLN
ncbi:hypothetical protein ACTFIU_001829 [Dictyostelium citrinum]